jgi:hypothetical protein
MRHSAAAFLNGGMVTQITTTYVEVMEPYQDSQGAWAERRVILPLLVEPGLPARWHYEHRRVFDSLGRSDEGKQLSKQLVWCRELFEKDDELRLACFDRAVGTLF